VITDIYISKLKEWFKSRLILIGLLVAVLCISLTLKSFRLARGNGPEDALAKALERGGLSVDRAQVSWIDDENNWFGARTALLIARKNGEPEDIYYAQTRVIGANTVTSVSGLTNLSRTSSAAEGCMVKNGNFVAYGIRVGDAYDAVAVLDTRGEPTALTSRWPFYARMQNKITNLQESGRSNGFGIQRFRVSPPATTLTIQKHGSGFVVLADRERIKIDPTGTRKAPPLGRLELEPMVKGRPGTITWVVDTVRNISWVGPGAVEWLEHAVFGITDRFARIYYGIFGENTEKEVSLALKQPHASKPDETLLAEEDIDIKWPPPPLQTVLKDAAKGEGEWVPVLDDDFVNANPNAPPVFYQTYIRVDPERRFARVYLTIWDPRQVQLNIVSGTLEPKSATGETGTGLIPRDPDTLRHLVGAFNGGFQALHGEFGMMANGEVYIPPKPWAATVAVFDNGTVGIGSWPGPEKGAWTEQFANSQIPPDMISLRQNLTSVVEDGVYNPWQRWYWGAAPLWAKEQTFIHRSGVCLTQEGYLVYFWGGSMGPEQLGKSMLAARCIRAVMLDMNDKHTGFEFYKSYSASSPPKPLARELADTEFEGPIDEAPGFVFRARLAVATMTPMRFPRYLNRDPRDFFYLTLKPVVPGADLSVSGSAVKFTSKGLPRFSWPNPFAFTRVRTKGGGRVWLVRIDPERVVPVSLSREKPGVPLAYLSGIPRQTVATDAGALAPPQNEGGSGADRVALLFSRQQTGWKYEIGKPTDKARALIWSDALTAHSAAKTAIGVDINGFWVYAESERDEPDQPTLLELLQAAGVERAMELPTKARLVFYDGDRSFSVDGTQGVRISSDNSMALVRESRPAAEVLFPDVKPMPYHKWGWMQNQRVRYFPKNPPRFRLPGSVD
jgi:hypothetical protein